VFPVPVHRIAVILCVDLASLREGVIKCQPFFVLFQILMDRIENGPDQNFSLKNLFGSRVLTSNPLPPLPLSIFNGVTAFYA